MILVNIERYFVTSFLGPKKAFDMIKKHGSIEGVLANLDKKKYPVPEDWPFEVVRKYFQAPEVASGADATFKWGQPDEAALIAYLCTVRKHQLSQPFSTQKMIQVE